MSDVAERRLAAIVSVDVVGYSRLIGADEAGTLAALRAHRKELIDPLIIEQSGRIVKTMGDGLLLEFQSVVNATQCAIEIQSAMAERNQPIDEARRITFRIGINLGDIVTEGEDIHGDGVNVAARLQEACWPGGLALSGLAHDSLGNLINAQFADGGQQHFKNIVQSIRIWRWSSAMQPPLVDPSFPPALPDKPSIAVLPFENMSGDSEQEYFADGIAEDVITALSRFGSLFVIARSSSFTYKGTATNVTQVAHELGVRYVVEGSVRRAGHRVRITAQLVDATSGNHLWADRFDGHLDDVFELQDKITEQIVGAVEPEIGVHEREIVRRRPPGSLDAWELIQRGLSHFYGRSGPDQIEAINCFEKAASVDPEFALAHAQLALSLCVGVTSGFVDDHLKAIHSAHAEAEQALALDPNEPVGHYALGRAHILSGETEPAIAEMETAISINPNFASAYYGLGYAHYYSAGDAELALPHFDNALRLSPRDPMRWGTIMNKGSVLRILGRHDEAIRYCRQACQFLNGGFLPHMHLGAALAAAGREDEAKLAIGKAIDLNPELSISYIRDRFVNLHEGVMNGLDESLANAGLPETLDPKTEAEVLALPDKPSIAVLPFENMSGDADQDYFSDGMVEDIITELSKYSWLLVIARTTTFTFKGTAVDVKEVGRQFGVRYVMEGSIRTSGNRVRINAQLIDAQTGAHVWAERFDRELTDIFAVQDEITANVAGAIEPELFAAEVNRTRQKAPESMAAWDYVVRGRWHVLRLTQEDNTAAQQLLREGMARYPEDVSVLAFLSYSLISGVLFGWSTDPPGWLNEARELAEQAANFDDNDAWVQCVLGLCQFIAKQPEKANDHYRKAIALNPSFALGHGYLALQLAYAGESEEAIEQADTAIALSPRDPELLHFFLAIGTAHFVAGRYEEAAMWAHKAVRERPGAGPGPPRLLAASLAHLNRIDEAQMAFAPVLDMTPHISAAGIRQSIHFGRSDDLERYVLGLKKAGMPE